MQFHDSHYIGLKVSLSEPNKKSKEPEMLKKNKKIGLKGKVFSYSTDWL